MSGVRYSEKEGEELIRRLKSKRPRNEMEGNEEPIAKFSSALSTLPKKQAKYRNTPTIADGVTFDSKGEAQRYAELKFKQAAGQIHDLRTHVEFALQIGGEKVGVYEADFVYFERGARIVEDFKSPATRTPLYLLKRNLMRALYRIDIVESGK